MTHKHTYDKEIIVCSECYAEGASESTIKSLRERLETQESDNARLQEAIRKIGEKLKGAKDWETVEAIAREIAREGR